MRFAISDIEGDTLDTFDDQRGAVAAMFELIDQSPMSAAELFLLAFNDDGSPFGQAVRGDELLHRRIRWQIGSATNRPTRLTFRYSTPGADIASDPTDRPDASRLLVPFA
jgi:hypothetical protein